MAKDRRPNLKNAAFIKAYTQYTVEIEDSYTALRRWLEDISSPSYWRGRRDSIYSESNEWRSDPDKHPVPSPVYKIKHRQKFFDSTQAKLKSEPKYGGANREGIRNMEDVLGARIVVYFPHQLKWLDDAIQSDSRLIVNPDQMPKSFHDSDTLSRLGLDPDRFDLRRGRKVSGYSSLHYVARFSEEFMPPAATRPWFEIQVRTAAEDLWGEIQHYMAFKPNTQTAFHVQRQFRVIIEHLKAVDMHLDYIYEEMQNIQAKVGDLEPDDEINAENLPDLLWSSGLAISQDQMSYAHELVHRYGMDTVKRLTARLSFDRVKRVREYWLKVLPARESANDLMTLNIIATLPKGEANPSDVQLESMVRALNELYVSMGLFQKSTNPQE